MISSLQISYKPESEIKEKIAKVNWCLAEMQDLNYRPEPQISKLLDLKCTLIRALDIKERREKENKILFG